MEHYFKWSRHFVETNQPRLTEKELQLKIFFPKDGSTSYFEKGVQLTSSVNAFRLFIYESMLRSIKKYTIKYGKDNDKGFLWNFSNRKNLLVFK